jgi:hypothetical protein
MKYNEKALNDFNKLCEIAEKESDSKEAPSGPTISLSKAYFYKAKALKKLNNSNDAILYFE